MVTVDGPRAVPNDPQQRELVIAQLDDSSVLAIAALRSGKRSYLCGPLEAFNALVVEELPTEFGGYGDPIALAELMLLLSDWGCVEVEPELATVVASRLSQLGSLRTRFYGSVYYELQTPVRGTTHEAVRLLSPADGALIRDADPQLELENPEQLLRGGVLAGAVVDGDLVARASCLARSAQHADIAVATLERYRSQGLATAAASVVAGQLQRSQLVPVWSTGETNQASQRIAEKLGFTLVARRSYVIPLRN